ncbi:MAG TPA: bifunctional nuclease domain-containing protein [Candidatus Binataceae bacterium]|nr:bifunctional nuclease domain-containing protein [Candidatus Binataceae bacterium]
MHRRTAPRFVALLAAALGSVLFAACAGRHDVGPAPDQVRVEVANVGFDDQSGAHYVLLEDLSGKRGLQILIGDEEARAIMREMRGIKPERPLTHDLLRNVIERTGNHVDRVVITGLHDQVYYADIVLDHGRLRVDSRPSDAIALAMGLGAPIFVNDHLFQPAAALGRRGPARASLPPTFAAEGISVQELSAPIAGYFGVAPQSGVLVAEVSGPGARAGLKRGDIVTAVEGHAVRSPTDFIAAFAAVKGSASVTLSVLRAGRTHLIRIAREKIARSGR